MLKSSIKRTLREHYGVSLKGEDNFVRQALQDLVSADLVKTSLKDAGEELSLHPTWEQALRPRVYKWLRDRKNQAV